MPRAKTSNVMRRLSTLRYEIAKDMNPIPRTLPFEEVVLRNSILCNDGLCEYCRRNKASGGFGDHFYPIIQDKYPTVYCDDDWNRIPACSTCNCSKGGKNWKIWFASNIINNPIKSLNDTERKAIEQKFSRYDEAMQKHCQRKIVNKTCFDNLMNMICTTFDKVDKEIRKNENERHNITLCNKIQPNLQMQTAFKEID
jgi:hypothetical protein